MARDTTHALSDAEAESLNRQFAEVAAKLQGVPASAELSDFHPENYVVRVPVDELSYAPKDRDACSAVDLRGELGPIQNQSNAGWCMVFATADLLSQKLHVPVSAFDAGLLYYQQTAKSIHPLNQEAIQILKAVKPSAWAGGDTGDILASVEKRGNICTEKEMPSGSYYAEFMARPLTTGESYTDRINFAHEEDTTYVLNQLEKYFQDDPSQKTLSADPVCGVEEQLSIAFPRLNVLQILAVLKRSNDPKAALNDLRALNCKNPVALPQDLKMVESETAFGHGHNLISIIDENLVQKHQIVAVSYNVMAFMGGSNSGTPNHISTVVARKFMAGKCQYMIRGSFGTNCNQFTQPCEAGNIWVTEDDIDKYVSSVSYLQ